MPGRDQLKQFSDDLLSLGDEVRIRRGRGERPSVLPLPEGIPEADDSDDFIDGMPVQEHDVGVDDASDDNTPTVADEPSPESDFLNVGGAPLDDDDLDLSAFEAPVTADSATVADEIPETTDESEPSTFETDAPAESPTEDDIAEAPSETESSDGAQTNADTDTLFAPAGGGIADSQEIPPVDDLLASLDLPDDIAFADDTKLTLPDELLENDFSLPDFDDPQIETVSAQETEDFDNPAETDNAAQDDGFAVSDSDEMPSDDIAATFDTSDLDDLSSLDELPAVDDDSSADDVAEAFDTSGLDFPDMAASSDTDDIAAAAEESVPEVFDTSEMDGVDFSSDGESAPVTFDDIPATGEAPASDDGFALSDDFEIPGFSDADAAPVEKKKGGVHADASAATTNPDRPPNTLSEGEYEQFKKNLAAYPLNLRIAVEDFIVKDEFKDAVIFEVVEKVLKKVPARQLAGHMEKLLDVTINVPRDYERRSVAEYEAYKQSFQYQLKNRILPMAIAGVAACIFAVFLFQAGKMFIYRPLKATSYYRQGYAMLENNEFPQSEECFKRAVSYKPIKKWFFAYARGYRERKQYERAAQMYRNTLYFFKHDKQAGMEYAQMELYDRANYPRAEEIVRRDVLDYYVNDADGILLLGDIFLEWAELDPTKYADAREQYSNLIQLYGQTDLYMSRMMRYFIRTDDLQDVLMLKNRFYGSKKAKKSLSAQDWTELSGYLLDKLYGNLTKSEEYLRSSIEDVLDMLTMAVKLDPTNPVARYNLARYFLHNNNDEAVQREMGIALDLFARAPVRTRKNTYLEINASRILGELFAGKREYLKAQEAYTRGINVFTEEHGRTGLEGDENTGRLYADLGDIEYFISGDMDSALANYQSAVATHYDIPSLNYRIGAMYYNRKDYDNALSAFVKTAETESTDANLLLSLANTLSLRGDNYAAQGYYASLLTRLNAERARLGMLFPQDSEEDNELVDRYLKANNNLGVTLYRLARQTGNSGMNAEALVRLSDSMRAWDALTRNQVTMKRLEGGNLAMQNAKYITHPYAEFEPAIYTDIPKTLSGEKVLE